ncbi:uncharacterized protein LAESUDRAFT_431020 [Laetiporus sulphureus 93-53]|uniref:Uncharacterized protein n=1 Tax=Laetiporus sulphureus 93-53 TaxID=1314785 RepID=A0A165C4T2_9APHY|nr:uncharacterized protein LAESUDRAFT_431020 [Laetiporus sulphureus 93-53]KZT02204.1 hypothetical protein LAESUDRAFT_431020 [Laetiporus sulphureus 93-53]
MLAKVFVYALLPAVIVNAAPARRGLLDDISSVWGDATSAVHSAYSEATSAYHEGVVDESATLIYESATKQLGTSTDKVYATVTTISSMPIVEVTSVGGAAITLATSGTSQPVTTTFAGHTFLVPSTSATHNAAVGMQGMAVSLTTLVSAATVLGSIFAGALFVL